MKMDDDRTQLEGVRRERAAAVPQVQDVPPTMVARARRRVARNAAVFVLGVAIPGDSGSSAPASACAAPDLRAEVSLGGAMGSVEGSIRLTNVGGATCTLSGRPTVSIFDSSGHEVALQVVASEPQWQADGAPEPAGWPVVSLQPGSAASVRVSWSNACPQLSGPASWKVDLGNGGGTLDGSDAGASLVPPCNGPSEPSTLEVGPFEPRAGA